jgi:hypothetical protein
MKISIFTIIMTDKIAFLFLTRGEHNNVSLWEKFFETADSKKYKILIHPKETNLLKSSLWSQPNSSILRPIPTAWGSITLVKATLYLIQMALADPLVKKFVLLSESCIPTNHFNSVYEISMMEIGRSRIHWTFGKNIDRYTMIKSALPPTITPHNWMKQSQWMLLDRKHVQLLFQPNLQARCSQFLQHFQYCPVPDEHFFINYFIHILKLHPAEFINHPVTFVDWNSNSKHPKLFAFLSTEIIQLCRNNKIFFARKFAPLQLTVTDINYILDIKEAVKVEPVIEAEIESDSESEAEEPEEPEDLEEVKIEEKLEVEIEEQLSSEGNAIFDYFSGTSKELKQKVVKLTPKQINSIYSILFSKPPLLVVSESDSESETEEVVNTLEVIKEETEDNLSEETDMLEINLSLEKVVSPNISLDLEEPLMEAKVPLEIEEPLVEPNVLAEVQEEPLMEANVSAEVQEEPLMEPNVLAEVQEEPLVEPNVLAEVQEEPLEGPKKVDSEEIVVVEELDEVELQLEEPEPEKLKIKEIELKKAVQQKNQNMGGRNGKGKKGTWC